eukprot:TRINITY_DN6513_c0_g1_i5.p1 TRINITY_DN6513_c0_g1~~TRINITY_DN6513_c0_g1_i5.p1  ORF type:complete len:229 (-),score=61.16 TRINITY_DN6513_c0_g1_i5:124-810(-)
MSSSSEASLPPSYSMHEALKHSQSRAREAEVALCTSDRLLEEASEALAQWAGAPERTDEHKAAMGHVESALSPLVTWRAASSAQRGGFSPSVLCLPKNSERAGMLALIASKNDAGRKLRQLRKHVVKCSASRLVRVHARQQAGAVRGLLRHWVRNAARPMYKHMGLDALKVMLMIAGAALGLVLVLKLSRRGTQVMAERRMGAVSMQSLLALGPSQHLPQTALLRILQ